MMRIQQSVIEAANRSGLQQTAMAQRRAQLIELRRFNQEMLAEIRRTEDSLSFVETAGLIAIAVSMNCDVIIDAAGGETPGTKVVQRLYGRVTKDKFDGSKYRETIKHIGDVQDVLRKALPKGTGFLADVFGNLAKNTVLMIGFAEDSKSTKETVRQSLMSATRTLKQLDEKIGEIDKLLSEQTVRGQAGVEPRP